jgi:hypothetical protein
MPLAKQVNRAGISFGSMQRQPKAERETVVGVCGAKESVRERVTSGEAAEAETPGNELSKESWFQGGPIQGR